MPTPFPLQYISASLTTLILYTYPAFVILGSFLFFNKKITPKALISLGAVLIGAVLSVGIFSNSTSTFNYVGIILAFLSALAYSFFNLNGEKLMKNVRPLTVALYAQIFSAVGMLIIHPPWKLTTGLSIEGILLASTLAIMASVLPFFLVLKGIALIGADKASIISTFELPTTIFLALVFLGEMVTVEQVLGTILILTGIIILNQKKPSNILVK